VQSRFRWRRRAQSRLPFDRWPSQTPGRHGGHGPEGLVRRRRSAVEERHFDFEVSDRAWYCDQLGRHGEDLAPHLLQRVASCARRAPSPVDRSPTQSKGKSP